MIKINLNSYKEVSVFLNEEKLYMHSLIVNSVKKGWENKLNIVPVIEFHINDSIIKVDIIKADFKRSLELALKYYEENEYYEKCMEINSLIQNIQEK